MMLEIAIPTPTTFFQFTWVGIGIIGARCLGKNGDYKIQQSAWFKRRSILMQYGIKAFLNFMHHWWIGALMMLYMDKYPEMYWFGYGLFLDDLPDIPERLRKYVGYLFK